MQSSTIPTPQLRRAWRLARAYGHEWAGALAQHEQEIGDYTVDDIAASTAQYHSDLAVGGIDRPTTRPNGVADELPAIVHTTGTGRLSWVVCPDGSVTVDIERPAPIGVVLRAAVSPDGAVEILLMATGHYYQRHVEALETALAALVADDAVAVGRPLRESAVDGHLTPEAATAVEVAIHALEMARAHSWYPYEGVHQALERAASLLVHQPVVAWPRLEDEHQFSLQEESV